MKNHLRTLLLCAVTAASFASAMPVTSALARDNFAFSIDAGNVRFGYRDGYWDHGHVWHAWGPREARYWRTHYADRYWDRPHLRYANGGWRDSDGDGVPDRYDAAPLNPYRR